ncbi:MAG: GntR family transcriptional regulator [Candidatus Marinimicrobia bacterium]|nr:GntR family transcriptional regulator [Candidatus Neomarinimicrobiota bacterium]MCF7827387.1 GntR family transcriptional regulator [Candidatus Neomarinimicrobiota bacterium]MCF7881380.1 GntR family transcriptional regulator [Candidatus Neomarinimicrobiota bacterium]
MVLDFSDPTPLYRQIAKNIKEKIDTNVYEIGEKIPSQRELADNYDVSMITVKKAISDLINEDILYSRVGKGTYVAKKSSRSRIAEHNTIGLVLSDLKSPFFSLISHSVEMQASEEDYSLLLSNSSGQFEKEERLINRYLDMGVDGLIIASMSHEYKANKAIRSLHEDGFPYVVVSYVADDDIYHVGTDHKAGAYIATKHLIEHGYEEIGFVSAETGNLLGDIRRKGFVKAVEEAGIGYDRTNMYTYPYSGEWNDYQSGYEIGKEFAQRDHLPEAMFLYNDLGALGFEEALNEKRIKIPEEVSVVGFDDIERSSYCNVPLTTIRQPTEEIGRLAVHKLIDLIKGKNPEVRTILKPELIIRESCGEHADQDMQKNEQEVRRSRSRSPF